MKELRAYLPHEKEWRIVTIPEKDITSLANSGVIFYDITNKWYCVYRLMGRNCNEKTIKIQDVDYPWSKVAK